MQVNAEAFVGVEAGLTPAGELLQERARAIVQQVETAVDEVQRAQRGEQGELHIGLTRATPLSVQIPRTIFAYRARFPQVRLQLHVSNRRVDVIQEGFDVAIRVRSQLTDDGEMVARSFGQLRELLVASPKYLDRIGRPQVPADLAGHTTLSMSDDDARQRWTLHGPEGQVQKVELQPTLMAHDFPLLMAAAREGLGVVLLPELTCAESIRRGELEVVLPQWSLPQGICHAIYPSRRGLLPAVRVFIDFLAERLPGIIEDSRLKCGTKGGVPCAPGTSP